MERHRIAHCSSGTSDKVYIVCVRDLPSGLFQVLAKWGRRDCQKMQVQVKGEFHTELAAKAEMLKLFRMKTRGGYEDIESVDYTGTVTCYDMEKHMEAEPAMPSSVASRKKVKVDDEELVKRRAEEQAAELRAAKERKEEEETKRFKSGRKLVVKCINNLGYECRFALGGEYNAVTVDDREFLLVTDMTGTDAEVYAFRFHEVRR
jgi:predicted DNA-binding WGR domain protein